MEKELFIREFQPNDAEAVSTLIRHTMQVSNSGDYPIERLQPLIDYFSPAKVLQLSGERICLVAESEEQIVGTVAIEDGALCTFFVHPAYQGQGIGAQLLNRIEQLAIAQGIRQLAVEASITGAPFYLKKGYRPTGHDKEGTAGKQIGMEKLLI